MVHFFSSVAGTATPTARPRFGGASASQTYATKVRWLVGALVSIISLLVTAMALILTSASERAEPPPAIAAVPAPEAAMRQIVVARQRIEEGQRIEDSMLEIQEISSGYIPVGAILAADRAKLVGQFAKGLLNAGTPVSFELVSAQPPDEDIIIPDGYRAISIPIDEISSVSYLTKRDSRVDVLLSFTYKGELAVVPVVETVKVLTVGTGPDRSRPADGPRTVTLLVTIDDAKRVELAKRMGTLTLIRAGEKEVPRRLTDPTPVTPLRLFSAEAEARPAQRPDGRMVITDPRTGRQMEWSLYGKDWKLEPLS